MADEFRSQWVKAAPSLASPNGCVEEIWKVIACQEIDIAKLPKYSAVIRFSVTLDKPYLSRDENLFYIIDNPVRREKVFGQPYVAASSWKGSLRSALRCLDDETYSDDKGIIRRLFGNERDTKEKECIRSGRLFFYPTFFDKVGLEVINPHDRTTRAGRQPIFLECAPVGAKGVFTLLYVPFDRAGLKGKEEDAETINQAGQDLEAVISALNAMFTIFGFGAKTSSGYGLARDRDLDGSFKVKVLLPEEDQPVQSAKQQSLPRYLEAPGWLIAEFRDEGGSLRELCADEIARLSKPDRLLYEKAKKWWEREGKAIHQERTADGSQNCTAESNAEPMYFSKEFTTFGELSKIVQDFAEALKRGAKNHARQP